MYWWFFVGMKSREIVVIPDVKSVNGRWKDVESLDDVVVTGYMKRSKSSMPGAVQTMKSDDLVATGATSLIESLKGLVLVEVRQSGLIGRNPTIKIRGCNRLEESTITGTSAPLFVIDGFIMNDMSCYNMLNPKDIETMTVLKDAEAMALYGSRGANGVIVIETKKGKSDQFQVKVDAMYGVVDLGKQLDFMSPRRHWNGERLLYVNYYNEYYDDKITVDGEKALKFRPDSMLENTTDWFDEALGGSSTTDISLSASGEMYGQNSFIQGSYTHQAGIIKKNDMDRFGLTANLQHRANDRVSLSFNTSAYRTETKNTTAADRLYEGIQKMSPLTGAYDPVTGELLDGTQDQFEENEGNPFI